MGEEKDEAALGREVRKGELRTSSRCELCKNTEVGQKKEREEGGGRRKEEDFGKKKERKQKVEGRSLKRK